MALDKPRTRFGFHSMTALNKSTGIPYGIVKIVGSLDANFERETVDLMGGSNPNLWDSEDGSVNTDMTMTFREFKPFLYTLAGYTVVTNAAEAAGGVTTLTNKYGTSVVDATTGIASVGLKAGETAELKDGVYIVQAASPTTVDIYAVTDLAFDQGTAADYQDDTGKVLAASLTISTGAAVEITNFGVELTGGSGTIGMTTGDTAMFEIRSINLKSYEYSYGSSPTPIEFSAYFYSQQKSNGEYVKLHAPRVKMSSIPAGLTEKEWKELEVPVKILFDTASGYSIKVVDVVKEQ